MIASTVAHGDVCQSRAQSIRREHEPNRPGHFGPEALGDLDPREGQGALLGGGLARSTVVCLLE